MDFEHIPVLYQETIEGLNIKPTGIYVDGTLGGGGHTSGILERLSEGGRVIGIDQDMDAITHTGSKLSGFKDKLTIVHSNYRYFDRILDELGIDKVDGVLLDLGVSSYQLDNAERGFSYRYDAPLDMRMDQSRDLTAADIVNGYSEHDLTRILREYGEEKCASSIARNIVKARSVKPVETTLKLSEIISNSIPAKLRRTGGHPAKRTFQAIRIELNEELTVLRESLDSMIDRLNPGGRLCVITFHSLEDRIVKQIFKTNENPCTCPPNFPVCVCGKKPKGHIVGRKPVVAGEEELAVNSRSQSAKLRVFERV